MKGYKVVIISFISALYHNKRCFSLPSSSNNPWTRKSSIKPRFNQTQYYSNMLNPSSTLSSDEMVEIVDENNIPTTPQKRSVMRKDRLIHRATYALIRDSLGYFYVQKRSRLKDYCPGYYDPTPGGVVAAGESCASAHFRECDEEMGIPPSTPSTYLFTHLYQDSIVRCFCACYLTEYTGELRLQSSEVESVHMMSMEEIVQSASIGGLFTPDSIDICKEYVRRYGMPPTPKLPPRPVVLVEER